MQILSTMVMGFVGLIAAGFFAMIYLYTGQTLNTSLANGKVGEFWGNVVTSATNFSGQLGTVGTIAGVMLILAVVGGGAYLAMGAVNKRGGSGM